MVRVLLRIAEWLDKRFPPKVTVTQAAFDAMQDRLRRFEKLEATGRASLAEAIERVSGLEKSVAAFKDLFAKSNNVAAVAASRRADFIASGRMAE